MAWSTINATEVLEEFTPQEKATLDAIQGAESSALITILGRVVEMARDYIAAGGYELSATPSQIPAQIRLDVIALARWKFLIAFPKLKALQTDERKEAAKSAEERFEKISNRQMNIVPPTAATGTGNWNSEPKILGRTHPIPRPSTQFQGENGYANPDGPSDA